MPVVLGEEEEWVGEGLVDKLLAVPDTGTHDLLCQVGTISITFAFSSPFLSGPLSAEGIEERYIEGAIEWAFPVQVNGKPVDCWGSPVREYAVEHNWVHFPFMVL